MDFHPFPPVTTIAAPLFVLSVILEWWAVRTKRAKGSYETKDALTSLTMGAGNVIVNTLTGMLGVAMMLIAWPYRFFTLMESWWTVALCFVLYDFVYYWKHRFAHRARWWWMEHVTHHSSEHYNLTTALRQPWFGPFTGLIWFGLPLVLIGFHPYVVFFAASLNLLYQFWIHTEVVGKMPRWIEFVMNTPSHHRVHHATNPRYLDTNYAGVFIIWDRMFGTFVEEREDDPPIYGIVKPVGSYNPFVVAYHELAALIRDCASDGFRPHHWIARLFNEPGWSPDGHHNRSIELKKAFVAEHPDQAGQPGLPK